jgi:hypothetical protein
MIEIKDYRHYLDCIKKWDTYSIDEQASLRAWYRKYYQSHQEKEQERYKSYYALNRLKRHRKN